MEAVTQMWRGVGAGESCRDRQGGKGRGGNRDREGCRGRRL